MLICNAPIASTPAEHSRYPQNRFEPCTQAHDSRTPCKACIYSHPYTYSGRPGSMRRAQRQLREEVSTQRQTMTGGYAQVGLHGCSGSALIIKCINTTLPFSPVGSVRAVGENPWSATSAAYTLCSMLAQTSPIACTSLSVRRLE